jgi:SAM-dependent methyltransferase
MSTGDWDLDSWMSTAGRLKPVELHTDRPQSARRYDYLLGGKTNFAPDRQIAAKALEAFPGLRDVVRTGRAFMGRAVGFLSAQGIDQFLDIGTGIPTSPNVHEIAQAVHPTTRIVYADNDPIVLAHAWALLANSSPEGRIDYIQADLRQPELILEHPCLSGEDPALDLGRPVAPQLLAVLHFLADADDPCGIVKQLLDRLAPGSRLVVGHATADASPDQVGRAGSAYASGGVGIHPRTLAEVTRFADGLELVEPGVVPVGSWRPAEGAAQGAGTRDGYAFVARKPWPTAGSA